MFDNIKMTLAHEVTLIVAEYNLLVLANKNSDCKNHQKYAITLYMKKVYKLC